MTWESGRAWQKALPAVPEAEGANVFPEGCSRIGDAQRERVLQHLNQLMAQGYLKDTEWRSRADATHAAQHDRHLEAILADLPPLPGIPERFTIRHARSVRINAHAAVAAAAAALVFVPVMTDTAGSHPHGISPAAAVMNWLTVIIGAVLFILNGTYLWIWLDEEENRRKAALRARA